LPPARLSDLMPIAPIALFTYCRPDHTRRTVEALAKNRLAEASDLVVYSDGSRTPAKEAAVDEVRAYLKTITGFRSVTVRHRAENFGLARSIIEGVTEVVEERSHLVVLEDDMLTSPHFLTYINEALARFADDERVASVHGYVFPVEERLPEAFFLPGADCWGWATWKRAWKHFDPDGSRLLEELRRRGLVRTFDFNGTYPYSRMLEAQVEGRNDSWAVRWYASAFLAGKLTLYPGRTLIANIGQDGSGTHCGIESGWNSVVSQTPILLDNVSVEPSAEGRQAFERFFQRVGAQPRHGLRHLIPAPVRRWLRGVLGRRS
jgi:hypothetical protein